MIRRRAAAADLPDTPFTGSRNSAGKARQQNRILRRVETALHRRLRKANAALLADLRRADSWDDALHRHDLAAAYLAAIKAANTHAFNLCHAATLDGGPGERFNRLIDDYLRAYGAAKVVRVTASMKRRIASKLRQAIDEGGGETERAAAILKETADEVWMPDYRSRRIARTEGHDACTHAADHIAREEFNCNYKVWIAAADGRVRDTHAAASGQRRHTSEAFSVGGEAINRPGELNISARNRINCRCVVIYDRE